MRAQSHKRFECLKPGRGSDKLWRKAERLPPPRSRWLELARTAKDEFERKLEADKFEWAEGDRFLGRFDSYSNQSD